MTRVALVHTAAASGFVGGLEAALRAAGRDARVVRVARRPERLLRARGFTGPLTHVPALALELRRRGCTVAHTFDPPDALAARLAGAAVVFTCVEELRRENVADGRLRLRLLRLAVEESAAVSAADDAAGAGLRRWMAVEAPILAPGDAAAWERVYAQAARRAE